MVTATMEFCRYTHEEERLGYAVTKLGGATAGCSELVDMRFGCLDDQAMFGSCSEYVQYMRIGM